MAGTRVAWLFRSAIAVAVLTSVVGTVSPAWARLDASQTDPQTGQPPARTPARSASAKAPANGRSEAIANVFWQPNQVQQGSPVFFTVEVDRPARRVSAAWIGKTIQFSQEQSTHTATTKDRGSHTWYALAGADLETKPGTYDLTVTAVLSSGKITRSVKQVEVGAASFTSGSADVAENFVEPDAAAQKQIATDTVAKNRAFARVTPRPLWSGKFLTPVNAPSTPSFGESRLLNEEKTSTHRGTDFPVKEGTPVEASNAGTVVLAKALFYEGNCVIVDHGERLFTIYMHLSRIDVKAGQQVAKGKRLGLSGATGRVTGPHVHMGVRWNGAYLDPLALLKLTLPDTGAAPKTSSNGRTRTR